MSLCLTCGYWEATDSYGLQCESCAITTKRTDGRDDRVDNRGRAARNKRSWRQMLVSRTQEKR